MPDPLRFLLGELAAARRRRSATSPACCASTSSASWTASTRKASASRSSAITTAFEADVATMVDKAVRTHRRQPPDDPGDRAQLWRARRAGAGRAARAAAAGEIDEAAIEARARHRRPAAARPPDPHLGRAAPLATSCSGRRPMPNCCSSTRSGPISTAMRCAPPSPISPARAPLRRPMSDAPAPTPQSDLTDPLRRRAS